MEQTEQSVKSTRIENAGFLFNDSMKEYMTTQLNGDKDLQSEVGTAAGIIGKGDTKKLFKTIVEKNKGDKKQVLKDFINVLKMTRLQTRRSRVINAGIDVDLGAQSAA
jgi:hypothetical protein